MATAEVAVRIRGVSHQFGEEGETKHVRALLETDFDIRRGELLALIGPSGCGKTTLLNVIGGLLTPTMGGVEVGGKPVNGPMPKDIAYVFQENALFPWNTVIENIKLGMLFQGVPKADHEPRARQSLKAVGLADFADHYPGQLSGGMRQRAALARALSLDTDRAADGRAVRGARRTDTHGAGRGSVRAALAHAEDDRLRDPQPRRGCLPR